MDIWFQLGAKPIGEFNLQHAAAGIELRIVEQIAGLGHRRERNIDAVEQFGCQFADLLGIFGELFLPPAVSHALQNGDERGWRGYQNLQTRGVLAQRRLVLERGAEEVVAWKEQDDEFGRRLKLLPVGLIAELVDVLSHLLAMAH